MSAEQKVTGTYGGQWTQAVTCDNKKNNVDQWRGSGRINWAEAS